MKITIDVPDNLARILQVEAILLGDSIEQRIVEIIDGVIEGSFGSDCWEDWIKELYECKEDPAAAGSTPT